MRVTELKELYLAHPKKSANCDLFRYVRFLDSRRRPLPSEGLACATPPPSIFITLSSNLAMQVLYLPPYGHSYWGEAVPQFSQDCLSRRGSGRRRRPPAPCTAAHRTPDRTESGQCDGALPGIEVEFHLLLLTSLPSRHTVAQHKVYRAAERPVWQCCRYQVKVRTVDVTCLKIQAPSQSDSPTAEQTRTPKCFPEEAELCLRSGQIHLESITKEKRNPSTIKA